MIDASVVIGSASALGGVVLGSWLSGRIQRQTLDKSRRQEARQAREQAYVDFLAAHRQFRRFLYTEPVSVHLVPHADGCGTTTPVVEGAAKHWEAVETANARVQIVAGSSAVDAAALAVIRGLYDVARARVNCEPGALPWDVVRSAREAENDFARAAQQDLV